MHGRITYTKLAATVALVVLMSLGASAAAQAATAHPSYRPKENAKCRKGYKRTMRHVKVRPHERQ